MPKTGTSDATSRFALSIAYGRAAGSPGPLLRNTPPGLVASSSLAGGHDAAHEPAGAEPARESARVDVGDRDDVLGDEVLVERAARAPVALDGRFVALDESRPLRLARLDVFRRHAVVADLRTRHRDDLSGIRRIGEHLLIPGHARVEHDFAGRLALRAGCYAFEPGAVFQSQDGLHYLLRVGPHPHPLTRSRH